MASIIKEIALDVGADDVWEALRDFGAVHERLVPGFVIDARVDGPDMRETTFFNGVVVRERLVAIDDDARRIAYSVVDGPLGASHHNAAAQVFVDGEGRSRFQWITDVLPDHLSGPIGELMDRGIGVIKEILESRAATR
jgi:Polyketide cyclase / dehydrase and lipid transport